MECWQNSEYNPVFTGNRLLSFFLLFQFFLFILRYNWQWNGKITMKWITTFIHNQIKIWNISSYPKIVFMAHPNYPLPHSAKENHCSYFSHHRLFFFLPIWVLHTNGIIHYVFFDIWPLSLNIMSMRHINVVCISSHYFFIAAWYSIVNTQQFSYPFYC